MGWLNKARAAASEAKRIASEAVASAKEAAEEEWGGADWYDGAKEKARSASEAASGAAKGAATFAGEVIGEVGATDLGQRVGVRARSATAALAKLPVFTLSTDVMKAKHGVDGLYTHLKEDTEDPLRYVWLAEAMGRVKRDSAAYSKVRSVADPSFFLVGQAVKVANSLGAEAKDPTETRLLKRAFSLSASRIKSDRRDAPALHVLARVYRAQGDADEAIKFSRLAYAADESDPLPLVTLAQLVLSTGRTDPARSIADRAVTEGAGFANTILADLALLDETVTPAERIERYSAACDAIADADREAYLGPCVEGVGVLEGVGRAQLGKLTALWA